MRRVIVPPKVIVNPKRIPPKRTALSITITLVVVALITAALTMASQRLLFTQPGLAMFVLLLAGVFGAMLLHGILFNVVRSLRGDQAASRMDKLLILWLIVALGGAAVANRYRISASIGPFQHHIDEFLFQETQAPESRTPIRGKLVVVDTKARSVELRTFALPEALRPRTPDEVSTIAWIEKERRVAGHYTNGSAAIQHVWHVTLVDRATRATLFRRTFEGDDPPKIIGSHDSGEGSTPEGQVYDFLAGYPRR